MAKAVVEKTDRIAGCGHRKSLPEVVSFLVTNRCVCRCKHCFNWAETGAGGAIGDRTKHDLSVEEIDWVFRNLGRLKYVHLAGGEPFVRPDMAEIVSAIHRQSRPKVISISTNGQLTENTVTSVATALQTCDGVHIAVKVSVDDLGEAHDEIRQRPGAFGRAMTTYRRLGDLRRCHPNLEIGFNTVFSALSQDHVERVYENLARADPKPDCMALLLIRGDPRIAGCAGNLDLDAYRAWTLLHVRDMKRGLFEHNVRTRIGIAMMYDYVYRTASERRRLIPCRAGVVGAFIDNEGLVGPCEQQPAYGSLRDHDYDIREIWHLPHVEEARRRTRRSCFCTNEPQWWHPSALRNRRLFAAGLLRLPTFLVRSKRRKTCGPAAPAQKTADSGRGGTRQWLRSDRRSHPRRPAPLGSPLRGPAAPV